MTKIVVSVAKIAGHLLHIQDAWQCISTERQYRGLTGKYTSRTAFAPNDRRQKHSNQKKISHLLSPYLLCCTLIILLCCHCLILCTTSSHNLASFSSSDAISSGLAKVPGPKVSKRRGGVSVSRLSISEISFERSFSKRGC